MKNENAHPVSVGLPDFLNQLVAMFGVLTPEMQKFGKDVLIAGLDGALTYASSHVEATAMNPFAKALVNFAVLLVSRLRNSLNGLNNVVGASGPDHFQEILDFITEKAKSVGSSQPAVETPAPEEEVKE
jgi:hypothetical protein